MNEQVPCSHGLVYEAEWFPLSNYISFVIAALMNVTISNPTCLTNLPSVKSFLTGNWIEKAKHFEGPGCLHYCFFIFYNFLCHNQYLIQNINEDKH